MATLRKGDRVAYSAKFLRSIGAFDKASADERATVVGPSPFGNGKSHVRVHWDHDLADDYACDEHDPELRAWHREHGKDIGAQALAKLNTAAFADNGTAPNNVVADSEVL